jgi:hypothetical protein
MVAISGFGVYALKPLLPNLFGWQTAQWDEWPEVIPPFGGLAVAGLDLMVIALVVCGYILARRWSGRVDFSLMGLVPYCIPAILLAAQEPRTAYAFIWPVIIGALGWIAAAIMGQKQIQWSIDAAATLAALPLVVLLLPFPLGIVMSDGMKSLDILAVVIALLLGVILPAVDGLLVCPRAQQKEVKHEIAVTTI